ncbi:MAG: bifunctional oligoribonuclease/PAP phosphatase NrnA [Verrucomicrobiota bacterium]
MSLPPQNDPLALILERVLACRKLLLLTHDRPDGDALGSLFALGQMLSEAGIEVVCANRDPVPEALAWLPRSDELAGPGAKVEVDAIVTLDAAGRDRIGREAWAIAAKECPVYNLDHHVSNTWFGDLNYVDIEAPATGEIVFDLAEVAGWSIARDVAINLYVAISTDTGSFQYSSTTAKTMRIASQLIDAGVKPGPLNEAIYQTRPLRQIELLRELLADFELAEEGRIATVSLPLSLTTKLGLEPGDSSETLDLIRAIDTVRAAALFEELPDGKIRVSSRSKDPRISVRAVCEVFGGGGHEMAAGTRMTGPLAEAKKRFLTELVSVMREVDK